MNHTFYFDSIPASDTPRSLAVQIGLYAIRQTQQKILFTNLIKLLGFLFQACVHFFVSKWA